MKALVVAVGTALCVVAAAGARQVGSRDGVVPCAIAIDQSARPDADPRRMRLLFGRIWLPRASSVISLSPVRPGEDRFGKLGLDVRAGRPIALEVPLAWRRTYSLTFAGGSRPLTRVVDGDATVTVHACADALGAWSGYAGGYEVRGPVCVPLTVRVGRRSATIHVSVGRRCNRT